MIDARTQDVRQWPTNQVGEAYFSLLREAASGSPELFALRQEWIRRPKSERWEALRMYRKQASQGRLGSSATPLTEWAGDIRA
jgi:hypothetical protein